MTLHSDTIFEQFQQKKIFTLTELTSLLHCSERTVRRRLKTWGTYTSYNFNGRYYTLKDIPQFDKHGIWQYRNIYFSNQGTLQKTLQYLIENAQAGLNIIEVNEILRIEAQNILSQQFIHHAHFHREKHKGLYIYYAKDPLIYEVQKQARHKLFEVVTVGELPTDAEAVIILVEWIKHPKDTFEQLTSRVKYKGIKVSLGKIRNLLGYHGLLKKTLAQKR